MDFLGIIVLFIGILIISLSIVLCIINLKKAKKALNKIIIVTAILGISSTAIGVKLLYDKLNSSKNISTSLEVNNSKNDQPDIKSNSEKSDVKDIINMRVEIFQNEHYTLPLYLNDVAPNGEIKEMAVDWDAAQLNTSKIGEYVFTGNIPTLSKKVKLTLSVKADTNNTENTIEKNIFVSNKIFGLLNDNIIHYIGKSSIKYIIHNLNRVQAQYPMHGREVSVS